MNISRENNHFTGLCTEAEIMMAKSWVKKQKSKWEKIENIEQLEKGGGWRGGGVDAEVKVPEKSREWTYSKRVVVIGGNFIILRHYPRYCNAIKLDTLGTPGPPPSATPPPTVQHSPRIHLLRFLSAVFFPTTSLVGFLPFSPINLNYIFFPPPPPCV